MRRRSWLTLLTAAARPGDALRAVTRPQSQRVRPSGLALRGGAALMGLGPLATSAAVIGAGNVVGYGLTVFTRSHVHVDLIGTGLFAASALAIPAVGLSSVSAKAIVLWSVKLASFLFVRVLRTGHDSRLDDLLGSPGPAAGFWFAQFLWAFIVSLPHTLAADLPVKAQPAFGGCQLVGLAMYASGLLIETLSDAQKWTFKQDPANSGKFCSVGLWSLSQHPNWLGNLLLWSGLFLYNAPALLTPRGPDESVLRRALRLGAAALSPLMLLGLFSGQASGAIGPGVAQASSRYAADPKYAAYLKDTPLIFPTLGGLGRALSGSARP